MAVSDNVARERYAASFRSSIFEPLPTPQGPAYVPAGKRRDQSTAEMFGTFDDKDLKAMPKTFVPKDDLMSAKQKKQLFLNSGAFPSGATRPAFEQCAPEEQQGPPRPQGGWVEDEEDEEAVDTNMRRQLELQSKLFGRSTPASDPQHSRGQRLTPNDFSWHSHPEAVTQGQEMTHESRAFQEKCSQVFDHQSPQTLGTHQAARRQEHMEDREGDAKRRNDAYYSDLFGRSAHHGSGDTRERRAKYQGTAEDKLTLHQDWMDSRTEFLAGRDAGRPEHPLLRKSDEFNQARIFGPRSEAWSATTDRPSAVTDDNSSKVQQALGRTTQEIHQAHLRSSLCSEDFYEEAEGTKQWEVAELHISGLGIRADDDYVRGLCQGFDLQIVKVVAEVDPVRNLCKGRAKVMVRYNPKRESIHGLVSKLEAHQLRVEM